MNAIKYFLLLFTFVSLDAWGLAVNRYLSGSWYNRDQDGHGFSVEVLPDDRTVLFAGVRVAHGHRGGYHRCFFV